MNRTDELVAVIRYHHHRYPKLQTIDFVKLVYQNEFGSGHLVTDEEDSLKQLETVFRLSQENQDVKCERRVAECFTPLGNGLCRIHLAAISEQGVALSTINRFSLYTAQSVTGNGKSFKNKLSVLRQYLREKSEDTFLAELDAFSTTNTFDTHYPVSHSKNYQAAYKPFYRVIRDEFRHYFPLFRRIENLLLKKTSISIAIDGNSGSGKSTLATLLLEIYGGNVIAMDHFFLPQELRSVERLREPGGNIDYERFLREVGVGLEEKEPFKYGIYDCSVMCRIGNRTIYPRRINIVEGSYSLHPAFRHLYDLNVFLKIDKNEQLRRIELRNGAEQLKHFVEKWIPLENRYFSLLEIAKYSDLVLDGYSGSPLIPYWGNQL